MPTKAEIKALQAAQNAYEILGVHHQSTTEQVRAARMQLAAKFHTDRWNDPRAHDCMARINMAGDTLLDDKVHAKYRALKFGGMTICLACKGNGYTWRQVKVNTREETVCGKCNGSGRTK